MTEEEPLRWKDSEEGPAALRALLRKAKDDVPPLTPEIRAAVLASLKAPPSPGTGGGGGAGGGGLSLSPAAIGVGVAVVGIAVALVVLLRSDPPAREPTPSVMPSMSAAAAAPSETAPSPTMPASVEPPPSASATAHVPTPKASSSSAFGADSLNEELALIARAQASVSSNPGDTLAVVDDHARRFPKGQLAPEREYLRIRALRKLGRFDEAKTRCRAYAKSFPSSPHAKSVRDMLAEMETQ